MNEEAIQDSYNVFVSQGYTKSIDEYKKLIATNPNALNDSYNAFKEQGYGKSIDEYKTLMGVGSIKKKDTLVSSTPIPPRSTTASRSEDGSLATQLPKKNINVQVGGGIMPLSVAAFIAEPIKSVYQFADDAVNAAKNSLRGEGFFDDDIPDTESPISDAVKKKIQPKGEIKNISDLKDSERLRPGYGEKGVLNPVDFIKVVGNIGSKIINSTLPQEQKNRIINTLTLGDAILKKNIKEIEEIQEYALPKDNIALNVAKNILGMAPDLIAARALGTPAAAEGRLAKAATQLSEGARPLLQKYVPKAAKFIEEAVNAPFTKIMAAKGALASMANAKEDESVIDKGIEGTIEGGLEGIYMHTLGAVAGKAMPVISKGISKLTGANSTIATSIANPLANAGVFTTARALRTGIEEQRLISGEEAAMEAGMGVGFSLLHAGSLYKNQRELNHYADNTLKTDEMRSLGRVLNETKDNLDLVYNPDLTEAEIKNLEEARDELRPAILQEPDLKNKQILINEALKIQNQLDAHYSIKNILENKDALIDEINSSDNLSDELKSFYTKKVESMADHFDNSEFGLKKKELDFKIDQAQKGLDNAAEGFTNLTRASDRAKTKIEIEKRRAELEGLNTELNNLITNKDAVQEQTTNESVLRTEQPELELQGVVEGNAKPGEVTEEVIATTQPEEVKDYKTYFDQDVPNMTVQENNGEFLIGNYTPASEGKNPSMKPVTDLEGNPLTFKTKEEAQAKLDEVQIKPKVEVVATEVTPIETIVEEVKPAEALKDVESTTKALENITETLDNISDYDFSEYNYFEDISKDYHKAKEENTNPEFVKAVEELLAPKVEAVTEEVTPTKTPTPVAETPVAEPTTKAETAVVEVSIVKSEQDISSEIYDKADNEGSKLRKNIDSESPKLKYDGDNESIKKEVERYDRLTRKIEKDGSFSNRYAYGLIEKLIRKGLDTNNTRKLANALRKAEIFNSYAREQRSGNYISTLISDSSEIIANTYSVLNSSEKIEATKIFTKLAKELGIDVASAETEANRPVEKIGAETKSEPTPVAKPKQTTAAKTPVAKTKTTPVAKPEPNTDTVEQRVSKIDTAIQDLFDRNGKDTTTWSNPSDNFDLISLKRAKKALELGDKDFKTFLNSRSGERFLEMERKFEAPAFEAKAEVAPVENKFENKAKEIAEEIMKIDLPDWLKAESSDGKTNGVDSSVLKKALADAVINVGKLMDKGVEFSKALAEASKDLISLIGEKNRDKIENEISDRFNKGEKLSEQSLEGYDKFFRVVDKAISNGKKVDNVLNYMKNRSEIYKRANDVQKELLVRDIRKRFGLKEKSAPSVGKLFGTIKDIAKITMTEKAALIKQIKDLARGGNDAQKAIREATQALIKEVGELREAGVIKKPQEQAILNRLGKTNVLSETSLRRYIDYVSKVYSDANYSKKVTDGKNFKKSISKLSKNKDKNVHLTELGKKFAKIDPSMVDNIDEYNAIAAQVKESIIGSTKRLEKINWKGTVKIEEVAKYIDKTIEAQDLKLREEKIAELQDLLGVDAKDFSAEEIDELLKTDKKMSNKDSLIAKATIEKGFDIYSTMIKEAIRTGKDPLTGEDVSYKPKDVEVIEAFIDMDLNRLTDKQALAAADALHNFLVNESTANMENVLRQYKGPLNAKEFLTTGGKKGTGRVAQELRKYFRKDLGNFLTRKGTPMGGVFTKLFKGVEAGSDFARLSGFTEIQKGKNYALTAVKNISKDYIKQFFDKKANGEKFNTAYNEAERGIVADLRRSTPGNEESEFKRRVAILKQSIKELEKGTPEEQKKAELYQRVYDKVVEGSKDISDLESKTDKNNLAAIEFWQKQHEFYFDDLANYMLNIHNTVLEKGVNYSSPDRYAKLTEETPVKLLDNEAMYGAGGEHLYKKEASGLMKAQYPEDLPKGRYRDYSFDKNNVNSVRDALVDMNTGGAIRQLEAFRESPEYKKIIPSVYDRNMVNKRMTDYVANTRNKGDYGVEDSKLIKSLDKIATIGAGMVLGSPLQAVKQTIPIIPNTIINAGKLGFTGAFDSKFNNFLNKSGYATGLRGVESQLEISSLNKKIELAAEGTPAQLAKAIENANKWWLKTFLVKPDVFIARSSWQAYYEQSLERQGISTKGIDYSDHKINEKAGDYAEEMVSRQQNVSDQDLAGEWFTKNTPDAKILKKIFLNMAGFRMNQSARLGADLTTLEYWNTSTTADKVTAARSLAGYGAEMLTFRILSAAAILGIGSLVKQIKGEEESDVDWEKRYNSVLKGQLTSSVVDTFSPAPFLDMGVKATLSPASEKIEEVTGLPLSIYGVQKEDWLQQLGAYGMAPQRLYEVEQAAELAFTGTYKDEFGNVKKISEKDQETIKGLLPFYAATGFGILPTDVATGIRSVVKFSKNKVTTDQEVIDKEFALQEKEADVDEKVEALENLLDKRLSPQLKEAIEIRLDELTVEDTEDKKQLILDRKIEKQDKEELLYDEIKDVQYDNESDLKKYNKRLWIKNFGPRSEWFKEHKYEKQANKILDKELDKIKKRRYNSDGSLKRN